MLDSRAANNLRQRTRPQTSEVVDVEVQQGAAGSDGPSRHVARSTDNSVERGQDVGEEVGIHVVEAGPLLTDPALAHPRPSESCRLNVLQRCGAELVLWTTEQRDSIPSGNFFQELPQQRWNSGHVDQAKHGMVRRAREFVALARRHPSRGMDTGVEEL